MNLILRCEDNFKIESQVDEVIAHEVDQRFEVGIANCLDLEYIFGPKPSKAARIIYSLLGLKLEPLSRSLCAHRFQDNYVLIFHTEEQSWISFRAGSGEGKVALKSLYGKDFDVYLNNLVFKGEAQTAFREFLANKKRPKCIIWRKF